MLNYDSVTLLGLGTVEATNGQKGVGSELLAALKNPVHAALVASAYLIWFLTAKVDASQDAIKQKLQDNAIALSSLSNSDVQRVLHEREHHKLLIMICRGVNKGDAKEKCDQ